VTGEDNFRKLVKQEKLRILTWRISVLNL
jgi:hypothetical protein